jgi:hypothetical protein
MAKRRLIHSERSDLIEKAREAMLSAVQIYNNPLIGFKTEAFIVLGLIAWTYLLHAHYRSKKIDYRYCIQKAKRRKFVRNSDGSIRHLDLKHCMEVTTARWTKTPLII